VPKPKAEFTVVSVNISEVKGTKKTPVGQISIDEGGVTGDAHFNTLGKEVSILDKDIVDEFTAENGMEELPCGAMGENITIRGNKIFTPYPGDTILIDSVVLKITKIGKECHGVSCTIFKSTGKCVMPSSGIFCTVEEGGVIRSGMRGCLI